jgi:hypothetical protein
MMTKAKKKPVRRVPITMRALTQRINRKLAEQGEQLRKYGPPPEMGSPADEAYRELGDWYIVSPEYGVRRDHVDPVELGKELGVIQKWETVMEGES